MFHIETLSADERSKLISILKKKLIARAILFISAIVVSLGVVIYFTAFRTGTTSDDNIGIINVVFVVVIVLCARLLYAEVSDYGKEIASQEKKVTNTRIVSKQDGKIVLGNKSFGKEDILLNNYDFDTLQAGDDVILEISTKSNLIFSVKKVGKV